MIVAHLKEKDWLKPYADAIFEKLRQGAFTLNISSAVLIELYYALEDLGFKKELIMTGQAELATISGLCFLPFTKETMLAAHAIMQVFKVPGLFDAIYAASVINQDPDKSVLSSDKIYDLIPGIKRVDPRDFAARFQ